MRKEEAEQLARWVMSASDDEVREYLRKEAPDVDDKRIQRTRAWASHMMQWSRFWEERKKRGRRQLIYYRPKGLKIVVEG